MSKRQKSGGTKTLSCTVCLLVCLCSSNCLCISCVLLISTLVDKKYFTKRDVLAHLSYSQMFWHFKNPSQDDFDTTKYFTSFYCQNYGDIYILSLCFQDRTF